MQFRQSDLDAIANGDITISFRRWKRRQASPGKVHRLASGAIEIIAVDPIAESDITLSDARASGCASPQEVLAAVQGHLRRDQDPNAQLYRVEFRWLGSEQQPRERLAANDQIDDAELDEILTKLHKMDARAANGPWTEQTLAAIHDHPGRRAGDLADAQRRDTVQFKRDVRKLKALGLTTSLEIGYRLSPRGERVFAALSDRRRDVQP